MRAKAISCASAVRRKPIVNELDSFVHQLTRLDFGFHQEMWTIQEQYHLTMSLDGTPNVVSLEDIRDFDFVVQDTLD
jgi:hypothetical protein